jgi:F-box-like
MGFKGTASELLALPPEVLELVLSLLDPYDLVSFGLLCKYAATFISPSNPTVWRHAFLHMWDDPNKAWSALLPSARAENGSYEAAWNWHSKVRDRCTALKAMTTANEVYRRQNLCSATNILIDILDTAYGRTSTDCTSKETPADYKCRRSLSITTLLEAFSKGSQAESAIHDYEVDLVTTTRMPEILSSTPGRPVTRSMSSGPKPVSENASKLHVFFGLTKRERHSDYSQGHARCIVYNWHLTSPECDYGPFKDVKSGQWGQVNWKSLEAVSSLITRHMELLVGDQMTFPGGLRYALPYQVPSDPACPEDWAGITGSWIGTYSFLDWTVLNQYNHLHWETRDHPILDSHDEARGDLMHLDLRLDDSIKTDLRLATKMPICEDLPMLYFSGTSRGAGTNRPYISVRGTVSLVPGARQARWRFIIRYVNTKSKFPNDIH